MCFEIRWEPELYMTLYVNDVESAPDNLMRHEGHEAEMHYSFCNFYGRLSKGVDFRGNCNSKRGM